MSIRPNLSILFFLKRGKMDQEGKVPIYARITIDGLKEQFSTGCKVSDEVWDPKTKQVLSSDNSHKQLNKTLGQIKTDLERHFDLIQAKDGLATPVLVIESYKTPINGQKMKEEKVQNLALSEKLDDLINKYIKFSEKRERLMNLIKSPLLRKSPPWQRIGFKGRVGQNNHRGEHNL